MTSDYHQMTRLVLALAALPVLLASCRADLDSAVDPADIQASLDACMQDHVTEGLGRLDSLENAHPGNADVLYIRGMCRSVRFAKDSVMADARSAFSDLSAAAALVEATPGAFQTSLGGLYNRRAFVAQALHPDDWAPALADFDRAVAADPRNPGFVLDRGVARAMAGDTAAARADLREFTALAPDDALRAGLLKDLLDGRPADPAPSDSVLSLPLAP